MRDPLVRYYDSENVLLIDDGTFVPPKRQTVKGHDDEPGEHGHELVVTEVNGYVAWAGPLHGSPVTLVESRRQRHFAVHLH